MGKQVETYYSGTSWEKSFSYSRVKKMGNLILVSGTAPVDSEGQLQHANDIVKQTEYIFKKIETNLKKCNASLSDVVRTRMFLLDLNEFELIGPIHHQLFKGVDPVSSWFEVPAFPLDGMKIEIEVEAYLQGDSE